LRPAFASLVIISLACVPAAPPIPALLADGSACTLDAACVSGECIAEGSGARCGRRCADDLGCADTEACRLHLSTAPATSDVERVCQTASATTAKAGAACRSDGDCHSGLCEEGRCLALCSDHCGPGYRCLDTTLERAGRTFTAATCALRLADYSLDLGPVETTIDGSPELSFEAPGDSGSITIVLDDAEGLRVAARSLINPGGVTLLDTDPATPDLNPGSNYPGTASVLIPSTDRPEVRPSAGRWRLTVGTYDPTPFDLSQPVPGRIEHVLVIFEPEAEARGKLDLILHFAPATGLRSTTPTTGPQLSQLLGSVKRLLLGPLGAELGTVETRALAATHNRVEDGDETRAICLESSELGPRGASVNVFIVEALDYTRGHAGGIPGPPGLAHTRASGIVIQHLGDWGDTGILLAHELGHFLGLRHTSELAEGITDPIMDTPECPRGTEISACPDYRNLMFPSFPLSDALSLTAGQIGILRRSPWLYEVPREL